MLNEDQTSSYIMLIYGRKYHKGCAQLMKLLYGNDRANWGESCPYLTPMRLNRREEINDSKVCPSV